MATSYIFRWLCLHGHDTTQYTGDPPEDQRSATESPKSILPLSTARVAAPADTCLTLPATKSRFPSRAPYSAYKRLQRPQRPEDRPEALQGPNGRQRVPNKPREGAGHRQRPFGDCPRLIVDRRGRPGRQARLRHQAVAPRRPGVRAERRGRLSVLRQVHGIEAVQCGDVLG